MHARPKFFSVEAANRTLPLVRRIVRDIVNAYPDFQRRLEAFHNLAASPHAPDARQRLETLRLEIDRDARLINGFIQELHQIGCLFKGFEEGLVDFYSLYRGRPILLCWKLGEERIAHWHEVDAGFAGRQPLTPDIIADIRDHLR